MKTLATIQSIYPNAETIILRQGDIIAYTHARVTDVYFLLHGTIEYYLEDVLTLEKTSLITTNESEMILGWELLTPTNRYISHIAVKSNTADLVKISADQFLQAISIERLKSICGKIHRLLETSIYKQVGLLGNRVKQKAAHLDDYYISQEATLEERILLLRSSPFFGEFKENEIRSVAQLMERREYEVNELIYDQDQKAEGIFVLIHGEVSLRRQEGDIFLNLRSISTAGYIFGWSATFDTKTICRASTEFKTSVYFIEIEAFQQLIGKDHDFGLEFFKTLIWLTGNRLQLSYSWYASLLHNHNHVSVKQLLDVNASRIPLSSALHAIPHLLANTTTHHLAFSTLHNLNKNGTRQERHLSSICLDLLKGEERELLFLDRIASVYESVSNSKAQHVTDTRKLCAKKTKEIFERVSFHLEGMENLPKEGGHIFIYNHLVNHPRYTLNNHFQLTLDSHFISAMILDEKYNDPGMRIVRYGKSHEFGHQEYYENLKYLNVYTKDSDLRDLEAKEIAKSKFYADAEGYLKQGGNLIISPEGTSFNSEESPGPFKMGPFNLAQQVKDEPYIVPVVFYNFDKRITEACFYCKILHPFKISEKKKSNQSLKEFVEQYQLEFQKEVIKAGEQAASIFKELNA